MLQSVQSLSSKSQKIYYTLLKILINYYSTFIDYAFSNNIPYLLAKPANVSKKQNS